jgi:hypothetical protein
MKAVAAFVGLVLALGAGYVVYQASLRQVSDATGGATPQQTIDLTDVRTNLMNIAQAERMYVANHGTYGTIDQLRADGSPALGADVRGYGFSASPNGAQSFTVTAAPTDAATPGLPTLVVDDAMEIQQR